MKVCSVEEGKVLVNLAKEVGMELVVMVGFWAKLVETVEVEVVDWVLEGMDAGEVVVTVREM